MAGRNDDLEWLYRREDDDADRTQAIGNDPDPTRRREAPAPDATRSDLPPAGDRASRRASFGDDGSAPERPRKVRPVPPPPPPGQRGRSSSGAGRGPAGRSDRGGPPTPPRARKRRKSHPFRWIFVLLVLWLAFIVATPVYALTQTTKTDADPAGERPAEQPGMTYLLVGSDSREGLSDEERKKLGTGSAEGQRTDTIMMLYVPPTGRPALVSLPRDSYVPIPGHGKNKINAAFAFGGPKLLVQTVEQNTGMRIDGYIEIGFGGFVGVIDALGGIEMCPKQAIKDANAHLNIPAGCQEMDGITSLGYVRARYFDPTGDIGRMNRQREMVAGIAKKAATPMTVINPVRWWRLNTGAAQSLTVGENTGPIDMARFVPGMLSVAQGKGLTLVVPISNPDAQTAAGSSILWDKGQAQQMFAEMGGGDTSKLDRFAI